MFLETLNKRSLQTQITWVSVALILITALSILSSFWFRTAEYSQGLIDRRMVSAENVLKQYLQAKEELLITASRVLTADFGFKQAVATRDRNTIASVLQNHAQRINADLMAIIDLEGQLLAVGEETKVIRGALQSQTDELPLKIEYTQFLVVDQHIYQIILLPVKAPRTIAYTLIGFEIDRDSLLELKSLTDLEISLFANDRILVSSFDNTSFASKVLQRDFSRDTWSMLRHPDFQHEKVDFGVKSDLRALLSASLATENKEFSQLLSSILLISILTLCLSLFASRVLSNSITMPIRDLVVLTKKMGKGEFNFNSHDKALPQEVSELNQAFITMGKEIAQRESEIKYQAEFDLLTGLYNRHTIYNKLDALTDHQLLIVGVNIQSFNQINDTLGSDVGDFILQMMADRIGEFFKDDCEKSDVAMAARVNADDFLIVVSVSDVSHVKDSIHNLQRKLNSEYRNKEIEVKVNVRIGYFVHDAPEESAKQIVRRVAIAVRMAKNEQVIVRKYQEGEEEAYLERIDIVEELRETLHADGDNLFLNFQPKLNLASNKIDKVEVLLRWINKKGDFVNPELFIALAENSGLIIPLTKWVINEAIKQASKWKAIGKHLKIAINVSAQDVQYEGFIEYLMQKVSEYGVTPNQITLELTERDLMENEVLVIDRLNHLKMAGFEISVDDYGIGQSSLAKLKLLPVHELKIDKSFIMTLDQSPQDQDIVSSTISLGHRLGMRVVAEGVENENSLNLLREFECDSIQGYFLSRPVKADVLIQWLDTHAIPT